MYGFAKGMSPVERAFKTLDCLERESGRNKKLDILQSASDNKILKTLIVKAYDWRVRYGIRPSVRVGKIKTSSVSEVNYKRFLKLTDRLAKGLSGNKAIAAVDKFFSRCSDLEKKWYSRVLNRDLRVGCASKTFNTIWENLIPEFGVQLGIPFEKYLEKGKLKFPLYVEPKYDGTRGVFVKKGDSVSCYSRRGTDMTEIVDFAVKPLSKVMPDGLLDVEFLAAWSKKDKKKFKDVWSKTQTLLKRGRKKEGYVADKDWKEYVKSNIRIMAFDLANPDVFKSSKGYTDQTPLRKRKIRLKKLVKKLPEFSRAELVPFTKVFSRKELDRLYNKYIKEGYEGVMIKDPSSPYSISLSNYRPSYWIKRKKFVTNDYKIVAVNEGSGRLKGTLGSLTVLNEDGEKLNVGTGLSDKERDLLWKKRKSLIGKYIEVKRQSGSSKKRFPSFRIREDK